MYCYLPKVLEKGAWTNRLINWSMTGHGPVPDYFLRFRIKPVIRGCPSPNPATSEHLLEDRPITKKFCPNIAITTIVKYFVIPEGIKAITAFLKELEHHLKRLFKSEPAQFGLLCINGSIKQQSQMLNDEVQ